MIRIIAEKKDKACTMLGIHGLSVSCSWSSTQKTEDNKSGRTWLTISKIRQGNMLVNMELKQQESTISIILECVIVLCTQNTAVMFKHVAL